MDSGFGARAYRDGTPSILAEVSATSPVGAWSAQPASRAIESPRTAVRNQRTDRPPAPVAGRFKRSRMSSLRDWNRRVERKVRTEWPRSLYYDPVANFMGKNLRENRQSSLIPWKPAKTTQAKATRFQISARFRQSSRQWVIAIILREWGVSLNLANRPNVYTDVVAQNPNARRCTADRFPLGIFSDGAPDE